MPINTYRYIRAKTVNCDTLISINNGIHKKDSIIINGLENSIKLKVKKVISYEIELNSKNQTISKLDSIGTIQDKEMQKMEYKKPFFKRKAPYYTFIVGFVIGLLIR